MNKSQSKYYNTAIKMDQAFLELLHKKDFEYITVKEICHKAGVNRSTFYLHYETVGDLLTETVQYIQERFNSHFEHADFDVNQINTMPLEQLYLITPNYLLPWLTFIKDNRRLFETFYKRHDTLGVASSYHQIFKEVISPILTRNKVPPHDQEYMFLFYVEGIMGIVKKWIREGCVREKEQIAQLICSVIKKYEN